MKKLIILLIFIFMTIIYFIWNNIDAVVINKIGFSHNDIDKLYNVEQELAEILGSNVINSKEDILYNLVIFSFQKHFLVANNIKIDKKNNIKLIENNNNLLGFYKKIKQDLGEDYYRLVIEPVAISKIFDNLYNVLNPAKINANKVLFALKDVKLDQLATNNNLKILKLDLAKKDNQQLLKQVNGKLGIYPQVIENKDKFLVLEIFGYNNDFIKTKAIIFNKVSYKDFMANFIDKNKIEFPFYSLYNLDDIIYKKGSIIK